jgi:hypothetical protein
VHRYEEGARSCAASGSSEHELDAQCPMSHRIFPTERSSGIGSSVQSCTGSLFMYGRGTAIYIRRYVL